LAVVTGLLDDAGASQPGPVLFPPDDHEQAWIATWRRVAENVRLYGWHVAMNYADEDGFPFAYSVGAARHGLPEILVAGIDPAVGAQLINALLNAGRSGNALREGVTYPGIANLPIQLKTLTSDQALQGLPMATPFHEGRPFPAMQMVYPDPDGRFPWDAGYHFPWQPLLYAATPA
jgi:hypothetical protein